jgi:hypothetical protein
MAQRTRRSRERREPGFIFQFLGWQNGWYTLRANLGRPHSAQAAHRFENEVLDWLIEQEITPGPNGLSYLAKGNTGDGPVVPDAEDGSGLGLLFRRPTDVVRFEMAFRCRGVTAEAMLEAIRREASVHKLVLVDVARFAHAALAEHIEVFGDAAVAWDDLEDNDRELFILTVREFAAHPDWTPQQQHQAWVDTRLREDWSYGPTVDYRRRRHPLIVPFDRLSREDQMRRRLVVGVVASLASYL